MHFLNALRARDRDGSPLPLSSVDLDRNGRISLLEAHTRVRVAAVSPDVPPPPPSAGCGRRWEGIALRRRAELAHPEEQAVVTALGARLELVGREADARQELADLAAEQSGSPSACSGSTTTRIGSIARSRRSCSVVGRCSTTRGTPPGSRPSPRPPGYPRFPRRSREYADWLEVRAAQDQLDPGVGRCAARWLTTSACCVPSTPSGSRPSCAPRAVTPGASTSVCSPASARPLSARSRRPGCRSGPPSEPAVAARRRRRMPSPAQR